MFEMELNQKKLSEMFGISSSRVSEYLNGQCEPTLKIAKEISVKLDTSGYYSPNRYIDIL